MNIELDEVAVLYATDDVLELAAGAAQGGAPLSTSEDRCN
jgi:hypothetical protein